MQKRAKNVFVHIGMPRAGSTFLQEIVFPNIIDDNFCVQPKVIKDKIIPDFVKDVWLNGKSTKGALEKFKDELNEAINACEKENVLISQEGLGGFDFQSGRGNLGAILDGLKYAVPNAKIIVVFRNQTEWLQSLYYLAIQQGYLTSFENFVFDNTPKTYWNVKLEELHHHKIFDKICTRFEVVHAIRFELLKEDFGSYLDVYEQILNVKIDRDLSRKKVNEGLTKSQLRWIGDIGHLLKYDTVWKEKYTFIPNRQGTSFRSKGSFASKFKYLVHNVLRKCIYYQGLLADALFRGGVLMKPQIKDKVERSFVETNSEFWQGRNLHSKS